MFFPEGNIRVYLYGRPTDMRKSYDGLYALARNVMHQDPLSGHLFAFINRRATQIRILYFDRSGWCLWSKRLEAGRFISDWSQVHHREMDYTGLKLMLEGIEPKRQLKRYRHQGNRVEYSERNAASSVPSRHADRDAQPSAQCR